MPRLSKADRVPIILDFLDRRYPETPIPLDHRDAYTLLVAVLLSAQCTDERVNQVTPRLFGLADNPADMARQSVDDIQAIIRPCGLAPAKAKHIRALSERLVERYAGAVPDCLEALEALPGVGHKTAQVVLAQAFGQPAFPVDTHIHRLAQRWGLTAGKNVAQTEKDLKRAFPVDRWNQLHLQIIYFGRECCTARTVCDGSDAACPLCPVLNGWRKRPFRSRKA
jgi:endonuclease-3